MDSQTRKFIEAMLTHGHSERDVHSALAKAGWREEDIYHAFQDFYTKRIDAHTQKLVLLDSAKDDGIPAVPHAPHRHHLAKWIPVTAAGLFLVFVATLAFTGTSTPTAHVIYGDVSPGILMKTPLTALIMGMGFFFAMMVVFTFLLFRAEQ